jgi:hypothetical protein
MSSHKAPPLRSDRYRFPATTTLRHRSDALRDDARGSAQELANVSSLRVTTIRRAELTESETKLIRANDQAIRRALEAAGVEFIDAVEGGGPGVRLHLC